MAIKLPATPPSFLTMPKRPKTPPVTADDETKFFTVVYPYPAYADMEKVAEQKAFARWLACCVGSDRLISIFHKPSVCLPFLDPATIIIKTSLSILTVANHAHYRSFAILDKRLGPLTWPS